MEFRGNIILKISVFVLITAAVLVWFRLTPAKYEIKNDVTRDLSYEEVILHVKNPDVLNKTYSATQTFLIRKERTYIPFYSKTIDTLVASKEYINTLDK